MQKLPRKEKTEQRFDYNCYKRRAEQINLVASFE